MQCCVLQDAKLGLPEVRIGLIPGSGGTQRLPRLVGVQKALEMIVTGKWTTAAKAEKTKLVDVVTVGDVEAEAVAYAQRLADSKAPKRRCSDMAAKPNALVFAMARKQAKAAAKGLAAPMRCIDAVEWATKVKSFKQVSP